MNHIRIIHYVFGFLFCIIAVSAFGLSYVNLVAAAEEAGIPAYLAPLWPICIDSFLILGSLFILQANIRDEPAWPGWIVLLCFTVVSTMFNVAHSPRNFFAQAAHALPPVALMASLELLMIRIKRDLLRGTTALREPGKEIVRDQGEQETLLTVRADMPDNHKQVLLWFTRNPKGSVNQARIALNMGHKTVQNIKDSLVEKGYLTE